MLRQCQRCKVQWINGVPHWSHGNKATTNEAVRAIVCYHALNQGGSPPCSNPLVVGQQPLDFVQVCNESPDDNWMIRKGFMNSVEPELNQATDGSIIPDKRTLEEKYSEFLEGRPDSD